MLRQRVLTGIVIAALMISVVLYMPAAVTLTLVAAIVLTGAWEWSSFPRLSGPLLRLSYVLAVAAALYFVWRFTLPADRLQALLWIALGWWVLAFFWIVWAPGAHSRLTTALGGFMVLVPAGVALTHLFQWPARGAQLLLFLLLLVWAADVGAYFAGRAFGRLKLAPNVSPSKTWEGLIGGVLVSGAVAVAGVWWFAQPPLGFLSLCMGVVLISIVGDLTESMFKRYAGVKDSGSLFPGHGGVLDRFDSITAAAPVFLLGLHWLESLP